MAKPVGGACSCEHLLKFGPPQVAKTATAPGSPKHAELLRIANPSGREIYTASIRSNFNTRNFLATEFGKLF